MQTELLYTDMVRVMVVLVQKTMIHIEPMVTMVLTVFSLTLCTKWKDLFQKKLWVCNKLKEAGLKNPASSG